MRSPGAPMLLLLFLELSKIERHSAPESRLRASGGAAAAAGGPMADSTAVVADAAGMGMATAIGGAFCTHVPVLLSITATTRATLTELCVC